MKRPGPPTRLTKWRAGMRDARRILREAQAARGWTRYALLVRASEVLTSLREPRRPAKEREAFRRAERPIERAIGKFGCAGCLATRSRNSDERLFARVERVVDEADPLRLLGSNPPPDEYHPVIEDMSCRLPHCRTREETWTMVYRAFVRWFDRSAAGPRGSYRTLAGKLDRLRGTVRLSASWRRWVAERRRLVEEGKLSK